MRILVEAFACQPDVGSETGYGWHYPLEFARRGHEVTVVTTERWRAEIETAVAAAGAATATPRFVFVPRRTWPLKLRLGWTVGSAIQYVVWLWEAARTAQRLHGERRFDVLHHATYGTLLGGTFLWRVNDRVDAKGRGTGRGAPRPRGEVGGPALVLGPLGGGQTAPPAFASLFGRHWRDEALRSLVVNRLWPLARHAVIAVRRSSAVLYTNRETGLLARRMGAKCAERVLDVAIPADFAPGTLRREERATTVKVMWLGRIMPRKALPLAVMALQRVPRYLNEMARRDGRGEALVTRFEVPDVRLEIVGGGASEQLETEFHDWLAGQPGRARVTLTGRVPFCEVGAAYERADIFVFPSLRDSTGVQLLEAMAYGLPVVCLDHQGARELVTDAAGVRVPVTDVDETVDGLAHAIAELAVDPERRRRMGEAARAVAGGYTWGAKAEAVLRVFENVVASGAVDRPRPTADDVGRGMDSAGVS